MQRSTLEVLKGARQLVEKGWVQGKCYVRGSNDGPPQYDLVEAVQTAAGKRDKSPWGWARGSISALELLKRTLLENDDRDTRSSHDVLDEFNDDAHRDKAGVLELLDRAITEAEVNAGVRDSAH